MSHFRGEIFLGKSSGGHDDWLWLPSRHSILKNKTNCLAQATKKRKILQINRNDRLRIILINQADLAL